jgi:hypothetical protein
MAELLLSVDASAVVVSVDVPLNGEGEGGGLVVDAIAGLAGVKLGGCSVEHC